MNDVQHPSGMLARAREWARECQLGAWPCVVALSAAAGCTGVSAGAGLPSGASPQPSGAVTSAAGSGASSSPVAASGIGSTTAIAPPGASALPSTNVASTEPSVPVGASAPPPGLPLGERIIPTDGRPALRATQNALPISGGTLLISRDGTRAIAADPERDRVSIVDIATATVLAHVALQAGDEPGRSIEDDQQHVHVVLRHASAVASIDLASATLISRRAVCAAPRGIAFEASSGLLHVACTGGELVSLPAAGGDVSARTPVDADLRDVLTTSSGLVVTRAKSAELLRLDAGHKVLTRTRGDMLRTLFPETSGALIADTLEPELARRTVASSDGDYVMLHQGARNGDIQLQGKDGPTTGNANPYGGSGTCRGVVNTEVTVFDGQGTPKLTVPIADVLAVDVAMSLTQREIAVAVAGARDPEQPAVTFKGGPMVANPPIIAVDGSASGLSVLAVQRYDLNTLGTLVNKGGPMDPGCGFPSVSVPLDAPATAVAYLSDGRVVAQTREPAALWIIPSSFNADGRAPQKIALGGVSLYDTGHELFHRDAGAGVACASCHMEGGDDGHVWHFVDQGPRRTQSIDVGLEGTAPFHWVGDMDSIPTLMENVFVGRMGGVHETPERSQALEHWMYTVRAPVPLRAADDAAALRGSALFAGEAQCGKCHNGPKLTNNQTVDVGTGLALQVPSLVGVAHRGPWLHTGCATTLRARFDAACGGGDAHGHTSQLTAAQVDDLVAYLETL